MTKLLLRALTVLLFCQITHFAGIGVAESTAQLTPVELSSFSAIQVNDAIVLKWETATEINNYGFEVQRSIKKFDNFSEWENIGFVEGAGNSNSPKQYSFTDTDLITTDNIVSYRLKQIDLNGQIKFSQTIEIDVGLPKQFELAQNYPNPFNPTTTIKYSIPNIVGVETLHATSLRIYNVLGEEVATLVNEKQSPGVYTVTFDASDLPSGTYFYRLTTGAKTLTKKMILIK